MTGPIDNLPASFGYCLLRRLQNAGTYPNGILRALHGSVIRRDRRRLLDKFNRLTAPQAI